MWWIMQVEAQTGKSGIGDTWKIFLSELRKYLSLQEVIRKGGNWQLFLQL